MFDDFNFGSFTGGIGSLLFNLQQAIVYLAMQFAAAFNYIWNALAGAIRTVAGIFRHPLQFLDHIWKNYLKPLGRWIVEHYVKLREWLKRTLGPIIARLQKMKKWYDDHILKWQLRIINLIQRVRMALSILRLFHVKWAEALDAQLAAIQNKVIESIQIIRGKLNEIISFFEILTEPSLLARHLAGATWMVRFFDTSLKALTGFGLGHFIGTKATGTGSGVKSAPFSYYTDAMRQERQTGTGALAEVTASAKWTWKDLNQEFL